MMNLQDEIKSLTERLKHDLEVTAVQKHNLCKLPEFQRLLKEKEELEAKVKELRNDNERVLAEKENVSRSFHYYESNYNRMQYMLNENTKEIQEMKMQYSINQLENDKLKKIERFYKETLAD